MPSAGDEGYETLVICPYDRSHEIRRGRMQFHLDKCRKNFPEKSKEILACPYNALHLIPASEMQCHIENDCGDVKDLLRDTHEVGDTYCPVKDLVPVADHNSSALNADECWDNFEATGSVLNIIKQNNEAKPVLRMLQCESKAKRKNFRLQERQRMSQLEEAKSKESYSTTTSSTMLEEKLRMPSLAPSFKPKRQDPQAAVDVLKKKYFPGSVQGSSQSLDGGHSKAEEFPSLTPASSSPPHGTRDVSPASSYASMALSASGSSTPSRPTTAQSLAASFRKMNVNHNFNDDEYDGFSKVPIPGLGRGSRRKQQN